MRRLQRCVLRWRRNQSTALQPHLPHKASDDERCLLGTFLNVLPIACSLNPSREPYSCSLPVVSPLRFMLTLLLRVPRILQLHPAVAAVVQQLLSALPPNHRRGIPRDVPGPRVTAGSPHQRYPHAEACAPCFCPREVNKPPRAVPFVWTFTRHQHPSFS